MESLTCKYEARTYRLEANVSGKIENTRKKLKKLIAAFTIHGNR
jgi:hypothetical protein